jgi:hypothetical protein
MKRFISLIAIGLLSQQSIAAPPSIESVENQIKNNKISNKSGGFTELNSIIKKLSKADQERFFYQFQ